MNKREFQRAAWNAIKAFVNGDDGHESLSDDLSIVCSDVQWAEFLRWIEIAFGVLTMPEVKEHGADPLPIIRQRLEL